MQRALALVFVLSALSLPGHAQVLIPVVVTGASGKFTIGLTQEDFLLEPKKILAVRSSQEVAPLEDSPSGTAPVFVLYDAPSVPLIARARVEARLFHLLEAAGTHRFPLTLVKNTGEELRVIHDFSTSPENLLAALEEVRSRTRRQGTSNPSPRDDLAQAPAIAEEVSRLEELSKPVGRRSTLATIVSQLAGLEEIAHLLQRSTKRKALIWITAVFPIKLDPEMQVASRSVGESPEVKDYPSAWQQAIDALNTAHISVYPLQVYTPSSRDSFLSEYVDVTRFGLEGLASSTGGRRMGFDMDMFTSVQEAKNDLGPYYLLEVMPSSANKRMRWLTIKVTTRKESVRIRAPKGFFVTPQTGK